MGEIPSNGTNGPRTEEQKLREAQGRLLHRNMQHESELDTFLRILDESRESIAFEEAVEQATNEFNDVAGVGVHLIGDSDSPTTLHLVVHTVEADDERRVQSFDGQEYSAVVAFDDDTHEEYPFWVDASPEAPNDEDILPNYVLLSTEGSGTELNAKTLEQGLEDLRDRLREARA